MESNYIRFTALSGAKSESALCYLLEIDEAKILLDCGWNDAFDVEDLRQLKRIAKDVDACLLSHSTLHHLGALAYAKSYMGLRAQTYATFPVMDMGRLSLYDTWQSKRSTEDFTTFNLEDIDQAFEAITCLRYQQPTELAGKCKGITITASSAGHTVGGTVWKISKDTESILYAVDYNYRKDKCDAAINRGGSVLLPTDSSTRVLELAYMLDSYWMANRVRYPLILLTNFSYRTAHFATSMMEWMGDTVRSQLTDTRENPFQFKYLRLCQRLSDLEKYPGPKVVLASNLSMESGFAREVFLRLEWSKDPNNVLILTERALPGEMARYLYDEWKQGVGELESKEVGCEVQLDQILRLKIDRKVPLEGQELSDFLAAKEARLERERADAALLERSRRTLLEEENDSDDDEGSMDGDSNLADIDTLLSKSGSHDVYMKDATKSGGFFKQTQSYRMFPYVERRKKIDDYGESIVVEHFLSASSGAPLEGRDGDRGGVNGDVDASGDVRMRGEDTDGVNMGGDKDEGAEGKDKWMDPDMIHPEDNLPSKYTSEEEDVVVKCKVRYVDLEGRADESAMKMILEAVAPRKLILIHGTEEKTESLCRTYLEMPDMTREIYTPSIGEILNVSEVTNMYKINLTDALLSSLSFSTLGEYDLAYLVGQVQIPAGSTAPVLGMPMVEVEGGAEKTPGDAVDRRDQNGMAVATTTQHQQALQLQLQQKHQQQLEMLARKHRPVFVGDIKLTEFKNRVLKQAGIEAEFMGEGVLVCNGVVAIRKVDETGQILLEGSPMSNDYYQVRQLLYKQFAIL
ncbi:cleavage and polyadenylation specificity factor subunit 2 [Entomortierella chlamydospora]|uniref:Cleavage and polyadenylation specificity factor subunit 2 n=1 Tax=Entomortierella chlamydospora TaxID=101097 RepID=A0A9P6T237_9FUNG|nr:cleavage and polyadenylation specificity factor subunit 2 [Entomortierella chlamydospora]